MIKTIEEYENTLKEVKTLFDSNPEPNTVEGNRLEYLIERITEYENEHIPFLQPISNEYKKYLKEQTNL